MEINEDILSQYDELKTLVETIQVDVVKNASGNKSAGVRARKGLRELKKIASEIVKKSLSADKT
tara:strand:- start:562 stop:753 length:192 start_codon:yes stop_codon:yes gene_type:complete